MRRFPFLVVIVCAIGASCLEPTEVIVEIGTDMPCGPGDAYPRLISTEIQTGTSRGDLATRTHTSTCTDSGKRVGSLVLLPGRGNEVHVRVIGHVATSASTMTDLPAERVIRYVSHQALTLPIDLSSTCIGVTCPAEQTCSQGRCVDKETMGCRGTACDAGDDDGTVPLKDAGFDAFPIKDTGGSDGPLTDGNVMNDGAVTDSAVLDGGGCPKPLQSWDLYWPFDEPLNSPSVTEQITGNKTALTSTAKMGVGLACNNNLVLKNATTQLLGGCMLSSCWKGGALSVAFRMQYNSGAGALVGHGSPGAQGSWVIDVSANNVTFSVWYVGGQNATTVMGIGPGNMPTLVYAHADQGGLLLKVGGNNFQNGGQQPLLPSTSPYNIGVGTSGIDAVIDELYVSHL